MTLNGSDPVRDRASNASNVSVAPPLVGTFDASATYGVAPLDGPLHGVRLGRVRADAADTSWTVDTLTGQTFTGASVSMTYTTPGLDFATGDLSDSCHGNTSEGFLIDVVAAGVPPSRPSPRPSLPP